MLAGMARAGTYTKVFQTGGKAHYGSGSYIRDYETFSDGTYGGSPIGGNGWVKCEGKITTVFEWQPAYQGDEPPASAVVKETCLAGAEAKAYDNGPVAGSGSASAQNGLSTPPVGGSVPIYPPGTLYVSISDGPQYTVKGGQTITVECTPCAYASTNNGPANASVRYTVVVAPVVVDVIGTIQNATDHSNKILIGQRATSQLGCAFPEVDFEGHAWTVPSPVYAKWYVSPDQTVGHVVDVPTSEWSKKVPAWRWKVKSIGAPYNVLCSATAYVGGVSKGGVTGHRKVTAHDPLWLFGQNKGPFRTAWIT